MKKRGRPGVHEFLEMLACAVFGTAAFSTAALIVYSTERINAWGWASFWLCCAAAGTLFTLAVRRAGALEKALNKASDPVLPDPNSGTHVWIFRELLQLQQAFEESGQKTRAEHHPDPRERKARRSKAAAVLRDEANKILEPYGGYVAQCYVIIKPDQGTTPWTSASEQELRRRLAEINIEPILQGTSDSHLSPGTER